MLRTDDRGATPWKLIISIIIVVLFVSGGIITFIALTGKETTTSGVEWGDTVKVEWTARVGGLIFDTNIRSVADAAVDGSEPAVIGFDRPKAVDLAPVQLAVGSNEFRFGSGEPRINIDSGLLGLLVNETHVFTISAEDTLLPADPAKVKVRPLVETFPQSETLTLAEFSDRSNGANPVAGATFVYNGWPSRVVRGDTGDGTVLVKYETLPGDITDLNLPFSSVVSAVDSSADAGVGRITVTHDLIAEDAGTIAGEDELGSYLITQVGSSTYTADYNEPYRGKDLEFTVVVIEAPEHVDTYSG